MIYIWLSRLSRIKNQTKYITLNDHEFWVILLACDWQILAFLNCTSSRDNTMTTEQLTLSSRARDNIKFYNSCADHIKGVKEQMTVLPHYLCDRQKSVINGCTDIKRSCIRKTHRSIQVLHAALPAQSLNGKDVLNINNMTLVCS